MFFQNQADAKARQRSAAVIEEDGPRLGQCDLALSQMRLQRASGLGPQRTIAFLAAFASELNTRRRVQKIGNAHLKWAFSEAVCLLVRHHPAVKAWQARHEKKHGKKKTLGILAARLGRTVYHMLRKREAFDVKRFLAFSRDAQRSAGVERPQAPRSAARRG